MSTLRISAQTIPGVLQQMAALRPSDRVLSEDGQTWTASDLWQDVCAAGKGMLAAGLKKGDTFAIWAPNRADWIICALAGQMVGGVLVPLNTRYKGVEAGDILRRSRARLLFTVRDFLGTDYIDLIAEEALPDLISKIEFSGTGENSWASFVASGAVVSDDTLNDVFAGLSPDDLCDVLFTSGTTGLPKGAMTAHRQNVIIYTEWARAVGLERGDVYLIANPFFHAFGYKAGWLAALIGGAEILPHAVFDVSEVLQRIETEKVTVLPGPPTIFQSLINHDDLSRFDISSLTRTITGAASVPEQLVRDMKDILGFETVLTGYGLTEATGTVALSRQGDDIETVANYSGRALEGVEVKLVDSDGAEVEQGAPGEIWVRGFNVMQGYLDDEAATSEAITEDGWLKTGDIGVQDPRGYLKITDRAKDMFITGGFNCYPAEIENILLGHEFIIDAAVVGDPDERLGEVCHAHLVVKDGVSLDDTDLIAWARENMANFKVPRKVSFHDMLPRNAGGKVQKYMLRSR